MITPIEIKKKAEHQYRAYLQSIVEGTSFFPFVIVGNKKPDGDTVKFEAELTDLIIHSKDKKGYGYTIEFQTVRTKQHGMQGIPTSISFQTESDYLKYIAKEKEASKFKDDLVKILDAFPELKEWISKYPTKLINNDWDSLIKVCLYFKCNPCPNLYIRELPIQVHTKFIETNRSIIKELLNILIAPYVSQENTQFEPHFNLKYDEPLIRFRIIDHSLCSKYFYGIEDLSIPISLFRKTELPILSIYIVENKTNMLSFPARENSIVLWGAGFRVDILKDVEWLKKKNIFYWGDLDAYGFLILSELRSHFKHTKSFLMDRETFEKYYEGDKGTETTVNKELYLTPEENDMFKYLKINNFRLEQEKIPFEYSILKIPIVNTNNIC